jgi:hypothetical protein
VARTATTAANSTYESGYKIPTVTLSGAMSSETHERAAESDAVAGSGRAARRRPAGELNWYRRRLWPLQRYLRFRRRERDVKASRRRLLLKMPKHAVCAEVGVWKGDGAAAILRYAQPDTLYLVDPWEHQPQHEKAQYGGKADGDTMDAVHASVLARFAGEIERGQVKVIRSRSEEVVGELADGQLDWAWIDGDHTYEAVKADLERFARIVKPGGYLVGDDYTLGWWGDGVIRAVDEFAAAGRGRLEIIGELHFVIELTPSAPS